LVPAAAACMPLLRNSVPIARQYEDAHPGKRLPIEVQDAVAVGHKDLPEIIGIRYLHLKNPGIICTRGPVGPLGKFDPFSERGFAGCGQHGIKVPLAALFERSLLDFRRPGCYERGDLRCMPDLFRRKIAGIGVTGSLAGNNPDPDSERYSLLRALDD